MMVTCKIRERKNSRARVSAGSTTFGTGSADLGDFGRRNDGFALDTSGKGTDLMIELGFEWISTCLDEQRCLWMVDDDEKGIDDGWMIMEKDSRRRDLEEGKENECRRWRRVNSEEKGGMSFLCLCKCC